MLPFRAIVVFHQVALVESIARAADRLGVTASAVSQQIRVLEEQIGTTLVARTGRNIKLTEAGERYFELISADVEAITRATESMRGIRTAASITIRATPTISTKWLLPRLGRFLEQEPNIEVRLDGSNEPVDFTRDAVDLEIRHGIGGWPGLHTEPLAIERFIPVCAPQLADSKSLEPSDVTNYRLIRSVKAQVQWPTWFEAVGVEPGARSRRLSFDRSHMAVEAAALGLGIALESDLMMEDELRSGRLVIPVKLTPEISISTQWLVCPRSNLRRSRVTRIIEWLRVEARAWQNDTPTNSLEYL
jgi:DNA-binding transcriptional LysR family regulator